MKSTIRNIGNSKGIILPKRILQQCFISNRVDIEVRGNSIIITPSEDTKRKGWAEAFKKMAEHGDDTLLIPDVFKDEKLDEWTWK